MTEKQKDAMMEGLTKQMLNSSSMPMACGGIIKTFYHAIKFLTMLYSRNTHHHHEHAFKI